MDVVFYHKPMRPLNYCRGCGNEIVHDADRRYCPRPTCRGLARTFRFCTLRWGTKRWRVLNHAHVREIDNQARARSRANPERRAAMNEYQLARYHRNMQDPAWRAHRATRARFYTASRREARWVSLAIEVCTAREFERCAGTAEIITRIEEENLALIQRCFREVLDASDNL